jgi:hypothetical protein
MTAPQEAARQIKIAKSPALLTASRGTRCVLNSGSTTSLPQRADKSDARAPLPASCMMGPWLLWLPSHSGQLAATPSTRNPRLASAGLAPARRTWLYPSTNGPLVVRQLASRASTRCDPRLQPTIPCTCPRPNLLNASPDRGPRRLSDWRRCNCNARGPVTRPEPNRRGRFWAYPGSWYYSRWREGETGIPASSPFLERSQI